MGSFNLTIGFRGACALVPGRKTKDGETGVTYHEALRVLLPPVSAGLASDGSPIKSHLSCLEFCAGEWDLLDVSGNKRAPDFTIRVAGDGKSYALEPSPTLPQAGAPLRAFVLLDGHDLTTSILPSNEPLKFNATNIASMRDAHARAATVNVNCFDTVPPADLVHARVRLQGGSFAAGTPYDPWVYWPLDLPFVKQPPESGRSLAFVTEWQATFGADVRRDMRLVARRFRRARASWTLRPLTDKARVNVFNLELLEIVRAKPVACGTSYDATPPPDDKRPDHDFEIFYRLSAQSVALKPVPTPNGVAPKPGDAPRCMHPRFNDHDDA